MDILKNKKGSTTILTAVVIGTVLMLVISLVELTKWKIEKGKIQSSMSLGVRSILSEYNPYLKDRYGILATAKDNREIEHAIKFYLNGNLRKAEVERLSANKSIYALINQDVIEKEIRDYMKISSMGILDKKGREKKGQSDRNGDRILRNKKIKYMLPSKGSESIVSDIDKIHESIKDIDKIFDKTKADILINEYIIKKFNSCVNDDGSTFFKNEIEYILSGNMSDEKNKSKVKRKLVALRNLVNLGVIQADPILRSKAMGLASAGGPASPLLYAGIVETWALAEAKNDVKILEHGGKIPVTTTHREWAIDIKNIHKLFGDSYVDNKCKKGMSYEDYLRVFLFFTSKKVKLDRAMDLMQINTQGNHDAGFTFSTAFTGLEGSMVINGKKYWFSEKY